jgi:hypothetical protein
MQYKTMILEILQQRPQMYEALRHQRLLLPSLERLASQLKASHDLWKGRLAQSSPGSSPSQVASEALELALEELQASLPAASSADGSEALSLDAAMAFLKRHTPPA